MDVANHVLNARSVSVRGCKRQDLDHKINIRMLWNSVEVALKQLESVSLALDIVLSPFFMMSVLRSMCIVQRSFNFLRSRLRCGCRRLPWYFIRRISVVIAIRYHRLYPSPNALPLVEIEVQSKSNAVVQHTDLSSSPRPDP